MTAGQTAARFPRLAGGRRQSRRTASAANARRPCRLPEQLPRPAGGLPRTVVPASAAHGQARTLFSAPPSRISTATLRDAWTLDAYAAGFGATLELVFPNNPDVWELAWIELALADAFVAADAPPLPAESLARVDWERARLRLAPSLHMRAASTNAEAIWAALWSGRAPEAEMLAQAAGLIAWRRGYTSHLRQVDALEFEALLHVQGNASFAALCELLVERLGETDGVARAGALLADWVGSEMLVADEQEELAPSCSWPAPQRLLLPAPRHPSYLALHRPHRRARRLPAPPRGKSLPHLKTAQ